VRASRPDLTPDGVCLTVWWFSGERYPSGPSSGLLVRGLGSVLRRTGDISGQPSGLRRDRFDLAVSQLPPDISEDSDRPSGLAPIGSFRRPRAGTSASTRRILLAATTTVNGLGRNPQKKPGKPPDIPKSSLLVHSFAHIECRCGSNRDCRRATSVVGLPRVLLRRFEHQVGVQQGVPRHRVDIVRRCVVAVVRGSHRR